MANGQSKCCVVICIKLSLTKRYPRLLRVSVNHSVSNHYLSWPFHIFELHFFCINAFIQSLHISRWKWCIGLIDAKQWVLAHFEKSVLKAHHSLLLFLRSRNQLVIARKSQSSLPRSINFSRSKCSKSYYFASICILCTCTDHCNDWMNACVQTKLS